MGDDVRALFVARPGSRAGWYRCILPAMFGGWDWAAVGGDPPALEFFAGWVDKTTIEPDFLSYDVVVLQQARGNKWRALIRKMQDRGVTVVYELDDYVHGVGKAADHDFRGYYKDHHLRAMETCMRQCDGIIFSTEYLADKCARFARRSWVCENGLDLGRYRLTKPPRGDVGGRETVTIIWAGATGHQVATLPWIYAVADVMRRVPHASFVSVGQDFASLLHEEFPDRTISVPFTSLECYPASMMMGDVAIAPAGKSEWYRSKSDLRVMEAAALGIPVVADDKYRASVDEGETGLVVRTPAPIVRGADVAMPPGAIERISSALRRLVENDELRTAMSGSARRKAAAEFGMGGKVGRWRDALREAAEIRVGSRA